MNLNEQLREVLKDLLPVSPDKAILGTALLEMVRPKIVGSYTDNSIRQTFSYLSADPTSPLARVEQGFGYYKRPQAQMESEAARSVTRNGGTSSGLKETDGGRDFQLEEKFRAFFIRNSQYENRFPVHIEHTAGARQPPGVNKWKFPDVVELDWKDGEPSEDGFELNKTVLEVKKSLGAQPFLLASVELKVELALSSFREHFFQCVSNSMWSHSARLVVAAPISDALLAAELRRLGTSYGVQVQSFNLSLSSLQILPPASGILNLSDDEFERKRGELNLTPLSISAGVPRAVLDWDHIRDMMAQSREFADIFDWIARCLRDYRAYTFEKFVALRGIEQQPG